MALNLMTRFATPTFFNRALFLGCAAALGLASIAAIAAPSASGKHLATTPAIEPSDVAVTAMLSGRPVAVIGSSAKPGELLHDSPPSSATPAAKVSQAIASNAPNAKRSNRATARTHQVMMLVTAYCPCRRCCGEDANGVTASGRPVTYNRGRFVAADTAVLPFGTKISIPGYHDGIAVPVIDRGSAIKGNHIDVYFSSHSVAKQWGSRWVKITVQDDED